MKKIFLIILLVVSLLSLSACVDKKPSEQGKNENESQGEVGGEENENQNQGENDSEDLTVENKIKIKIGETVLSAVLAKNSATEELLGKLPVTVNMSDYGNFEKVGDLNFDLPTSDQRITTQPCDFVLYQGDKLVIFYGSNTWSYTRLGRIENITGAELREILGSGNVTVTLYKA